MKNLFASVKNSKAFEAVKGTTVKAMDSKLVVNIKVQAIKAWDSKALVAMREQSIKAYESTMAMAKSVMTKDEAKAAIKMIESLIVKETKLGDYHAALGKKAHEDEAMEEDIAIFHMEEGKASLVRVIELKRSLNLMKVIYRMEEMMEGLDEQGKEVLATQLEKLRDELASN